MPRTKVSKTSKRNREAAVREEKIREYERCLESYLTEMDLRGNALITQIELDMQQLKAHFCTVLNEPFEEVLNFENAGESKPCESKTATSPTQALAARKGSVNDDGYITEDSGNSASSSALTAFLSTTQRNRTQASAVQMSHKRLLRRSRSACSDNHPRLAAAPKINASKSAISEHGSRNKLRTPMSSRPKAISADRSVGTLHNSLASAFFRWPKPGEFVVSVNGSPLVAQAVPGRFANVNIPFKDGVLSLRPKRLEDFDCQILEKFDEETLSQIQTLKENLGKIVSLATKNNS